MSHLVPGDPTAYPINITVPDNGDSRDASAVAVPIGGLIDRTAWARAHIEKALPMFAHWVSVSATDVDVVKYSPATRQWCGMSTSVADKFQRTRDYTTWSGTTEITGTLVLSPAKYGDFEVNPAGHIVIVPNTYDAVVEYNGTAWSKVTGPFGSDPDGTAPRCVNVKWSPTPALWCVAFNRGGVLAPKAYYSSDRVTWTGVNLPFAVSTEVKLGSDGASTLVAMGRNDGDILFSRSTDGGVTWSAAQTIATGLTTSIVLPQVEPIWTGTKWVAVAFDNSTSTLYQSADGLTWSTLKAFTAFAVQSMCSVGPALLVASNDGDMAASFDDGTTWYYLDRRLNSAGVGCLRLAGSRLIASGGSSLYVAQAFGPSTVTVA